MLVAAEIPTLAKSDLALLKQYVAVLCDNGIDIYLICV